MVERCRKQGEKAKGQEGKGLHNPLRKEMCSLIGARKGKSVRKCESAGADTKANTRAAAHFSSLSTPFSLMQLAMMMAEATPSPLPDRSIFSVGFVPLSSSI